MGPAVAAAAGGDGDAGDMMLSRLVQDERDVQVRLLYSRYSHSDVRHHDGLILNLYCVI